MTPRERILAALNFQPPDRLPKDLAGMRSTGVSAFTYQALRNALDLPTKPTRIHDTGQMLALPHTDVLDALGCDVVSVEGDGVTNAFEQPERWHDYDFNGRIPHAQVQNPADYHVDADGTIHQGPDTTMPSGAHVFESEHGGQPLLLNGDLPRPDLKKTRKQLDDGQLKDDQIKSLRETCRRIRQSTDRAVFLWGPTNLGISIHGFGGLAVFPVLCLEDPAYVHELHTLHLKYALKNVRALIPEISDCVDIVSTDADDWGNQLSLMASPDTFHDLYLPYRQKHNAEIHRLAPHLKTFLHSCGAIYEILDDILKSGTDILNPVQWPAGDRSAEQWKDKARGKMTLWGGGVNAQHTLPGGTLEQIADDVRQSVAVLAHDSGYVFANIHNLLAEIAPDRILTIYRTAAGI